jgi:hypothetical protein
MVLLVPVLLTLVVRMAIIRRGAVMRVVCVQRNMSGCRVLWNSGEVEEGVLSLVYGELHYHWLPGFIQTLEHRNMGVPHPQGKEWFVVFQIDHQPKSPPTAKLLYRPSIDRFMVPGIKLSAHRKLTIKSVRWYLRRFLDGKP